MHAILFLPFVRFRFFSRVLVKLQCLQRILAMFWQPRKQNKRKETEPAIPVVSSAKPEPIDAMKVFAEFEESQTKRRKQKEEEKTKKKQLEEGEESKAEKKSGKESKETKETTSDLRLRRKANPALVNASRWSSTRVFDPSAVATNVTWTLPPETVCLQKASSLSDPVDFPTSFRLTTASSWRLTLRLLSTST